MRQPNDRSDDLSLRTNRCRCGPQRHLTFPTRFRCRATKSKLDLQRHQPPRSDSSFYDHLKQPAPTPLIPKKLNIPLSPHFLLAIRVVISPFIWVVILSMELCERSVCLVFQFVDKNGQRRPGRYLSTCNAAKH
ncbi:hypothetical protein PGT21_031170 [Puccinia graminis f. sp. tritici]|uniref:Uncharacterized protein n=1 Tax=Puccinia graminis f. sp. tritici TaxID=56615 RepID=A0A5B0PPE3_PUCGR|nr:hypothetical protein PGT21_031170 [Puccinia graminis f. sp. tritici]